MYLLLVTVGMSLRHLREVSGIPPLPLGKVAKRTEKWLQSADVRSHAFIRNIDLRVQFRGSGMIHSAERPTTTFKISTRGHHVQLEQVVQGLGNTKWAELDIASKQIRELALNIARNRNNFKGFQLSDIMKLTQLLNW